MPRNGTKTSKVGNFPRRGDSPGQRIPDSLAQWPNCVIFVTWMRTVIDDRIPYIRKAMEGITREAVYLKGPAIGPGDVRDADALIVRTRTMCGEGLLRGSKARFVATATAGFDHIDTDYMERAGIHWMCCPGCNSSSVAQYVHSVLLLLKRERDLSGMTIGVVGHGHVGSKVAARARETGMRVLVCDPPLGESGALAGSVGLGEIAREADVVTFHVPLTRSGPHATFHMADGAFLGSLAKGPVVINTSRGGVVDEGALLHAMDSGRVGRAVIDTWENEPEISADLLERAWIATPHVAGYSADGKANATNMVLEGLCRHFGIADVPRVEPPPLPVDFTVPSDPDALCLKLYDPTGDSLRLKAAPEAFERLRDGYPLRRERLS